MNTIDPHTRGVTVMTMRLAAGLALLLGSSMVALPPAVAQSPQPDGAPAQIQDGWRTAAPADVGMDPARLEELTRALHRGEHGNVHAMLIEKDGRLVYEEYFSGEDEAWGADLGKVTFGRSSLHDLRSVTKTVVSTLVGIAIGRGEIPSVDTPLYELLPDYAHLLTGEKRSIRLRHVLTMSAGLEWDEWSIPYTNPANDEIRLTRSSDPVAFVLGRERVSEPGTEFNYSGGLTQLLAAILERATDRGVEAYAREVLFVPLGIHDAVWRGNLNGMPAAASGLRLLARDLAKIGSLYLNGGRWNGRQIVPADWVAEARVRRVIRPTPETVPEFVLDGGYGYQWWSMRYATSHGEVDVYTMVGNGQQRVMVVPELSLAVTMFAGHYNDHSRAWMPGRLLVEYIVEALIP
jgi:CubicO group peptidase (beta-lactamase class C family)